jgi:hypothetical protein
LGLKVVVHCLDQVVRQCHCRSFHKAIITPSAERGEIDYSDEVGEIGDENRLDVS